MISPNPLQGIKNVADKEVDQLLVLTVAIRQESNENPSLDYSYTLILIALLEATDPTSRWFQAYTKEKTVKIDDIYQKKSVSLKGKGSRKQVPNTNPDSYYDSSRFSESAGRLFEFALDLSAKTTPSQTARLGVRHLLATYLYAPQFHEEQLKNYGYDFQDCANSLLNFVRTRYPNDNFKAWEKLHIERFSRPPVLTPLKLDGLPKFHSDMGATEDLLDIKRDVNPLAMLIAAKKTAPPLAIGIFGDWGSGKSFFMGKLRERIGEITVEAQQTPELSTTFYRHIAHIEFNAWHYIEGNLWASLVDHIMTTLVDSTEKPVKDIEKLLSVDLKFTTQQITATQKQAESIENDIDSAQLKIKDLEKDYTDKVTTLSNISVRNVIVLALNESGVTSSIETELKQLGFGNLLSKTENSYQALQVARNEMAQTGAWLLPLADPETAKSQWRRWEFVLLFLIVSLGIPIVVTWILNETVNESIAQIFGLLTTIITSIGFVTKWIRDRLQQLSNIRERLESANQKIQRLAEMNLLEQKADILKAELLLKEKQDALTSARQKEEHLRLQQQKIQRELDALKPERILESFLKDRAQSDDYRKHLGIPALIRRDFNKLSDKIDKLNKALNTITQGTEMQENVKESLLLNRIVLYIDDLDRCPPERVVEVLQAIHLLLAFPLFVVVVGVDSRWVTHSLRSYYPGLLGGLDKMGKENKREIQVEEPMNNEIHASPFQYLQKIFQIPLWLDQIDDERASKMLRGLLKEEMIIAEEPTNGQDEQTAPIRREDSRQGDGNENEPKPEPSFIPKLNPKSLEVNNTEVALMEQLAPILNRTPREVKRFINIYRLIKARVTNEDELNHFTEEEFRAVIFLLAVDTGLPSIAGVLYEEIKSAHSKKIETLGDFLRSEELPPLLKPLQTWLENIKDSSSWGRIPLEETVKLISQVRRYSFHQN